MLHENRNEEFKFTVIENRAATLPYFENIYKNTALFLWYNACNDSEKNWKRLHWSSIIAFVASDSLGKHLN